MALPSSIFTTRRVWTLIQYFATTHSPYTGNCPQQFGRVIKFFWACNYLASTYCRQGCGQAALRPASQRLNSLSLWIRRCIHTAVDADRSVVMASPLIPPGCGASRVYPRGGNSCWLDLSLLDLGGLRLLPVYLSLLPSKAMMGLPVGPVSEANQMTSSEQLLQWPDWFKWHWNDAILLHIRYCYSFKCHFCISASDIVHPLFVFIKPLDVSWICSIKFMTESCKYCNLITIELYSKNAIYNYKYKKYL